MKTTSIFIFSLMIIFSSAFAQTTKDSLIVFVGKKIYVKSIPEETNTPRIDTNFVGNDTVLITSETISFDNKYLAKYKILKVLNGIYKNDSIEFIVYDHYGEPEFSKFETVLLFVSFKNGKLYHQKYQYYDLYLTDDNKWASSYSSIDYNHPLKNGITVKPTKIKFKNEVSYPVDNLSPKEIKYYYPKPYYKIKKRKAIALYGNYVEDLFILKQQTILKARGIY